MPLVRSGTMRPSLALSVITLTLLGLSATMCSPRDDAGEDPTSGTPSAVLGHYRGVGVGTSATAVVTLDVTAGTTDAQALRPLESGGGSYSIRGSVVVDVAGVGRVDLTGSVDLATNTARFQGTAAGGAVSFEGRVERGALSGTLTIPPLGDLPLSLVNEALGGIHMYCGSIGGGATGRAAVVTAAEFAGAVFGSGRGGLVGGQGTLRDGRLEVALVPEGSARGRLTGDRIDGDVTFDGASGTFGASEAACAAIESSAGVADGGVDDGSTVDGEADGGGSTDDGGTGGSPETVTTLAGSIDVGHLAVDAGKLFFSYRYAQFQQSLRIGSVGVDGTGLTDLVPLTTKGAVGSLSVMGSKLYYIQGTDGFPGYLEAVPTAGGAHQTLGSVPSQTVDTVRSLKNDGTRLYYSPPRNGFSERNGVRAYDADGVLVAGPAGFDIGGGATVADGFGIDGSVIFFGAGSTGDGVRSIAKTLTGPSSPILTGAELGQFAFADDIVTDATSIYVLGWASFETRLLRKNKDGSGAATNVLPEALKGNCSGLVLLGDYLYFVKQDAVTGQGGPTPFALYRVRKDASGADPQKVGAATGFPPVTDGSWVYWSSGKSVMRVRN